MTPTNEGLTILQRSVCLTLTCHEFGNHRKVDLAQLELRRRQAATAASGETLLDGPPAEPEAELETGQLHLSKKLVSQKELTAAYRVAGKAKQYLRSRAISAHRIFGESTYLLPVGLTLEVSARLQAFRQELADEALALRSRWERIVAEQAATLGPLFRAADYPTATEVERSFSLSWIYVQFNAPDLLQTVDQALFEAARDDHDRRLSGAYDEVRLVLRETLRELTAEIARKLEPGADGKPRIFKGTVLSGLADFLSTFELRNIADDAELAAVVARCRALTEGVSRDDLLGQDALRETVRAGMAAATAHLGGLVETGRRAFDFGEAA